MTETIVVPCVYGGFYWVALADYANPERTYLPLYTRTGKRFDETTRGMKRGVATMLHRDNIGHPPTDEDC